MSLTVINLEVSLKPHCAIHYLFNYYNLSQGVDT